MEAQCNGGEQKYGGICDIETLGQNLAANCIPETVSAMDIEDYATFLGERRVLISKKIKDYYFSL